MHASAHNTLCSPAHTKPASHPRCGRSSCLTFRATRMSSACLYDGGRDGFLARSTSKPPSKFDSIEFLERDDKSCITSTRSVTSSKKTSRIIADSELGGRSIGRSVHSARSASSSNATAMGAWSWGDGNSSRANTEATQAASSWKAEVSGRSTCSKPLTAPLSASSSSSSRHKRFFWGPKVTRPGQEAAREIRRTNTGDPATFALTVDKCPSTVPAIRSLVPRRFHSTTAGSSIDDPTKLIDGPSSAYEGLEPYIRTSITDRVHDGIYDTDVAHKSTLGGRIKRGEVLSPEISRGGKRFAEAIAAPGPQKLMGPGHYDTSPGIDATTWKSTNFLPFPREKCNYDSYIHASLGQTTGAAIGPGKYGWKPATDKARGPLAFSNIVRWAKDSTSKMSANQGPWDDVKEAWGRGGYIERAVPRECKSYLPPEVMWYANQLDLDHLGKETLNTAMRHNSRRYAASFSNTQEPNWRVRGDPALGPGSYAIERAETLTLPAPQGGAGDADPARPSLPFRSRRTPFDTQHLADGYKTLKPRFATPRCALYASEPTGGAPGPTADTSAATSVAERAAGEVVLPESGERRRLTPAAKAAELNAAAAADPWRIGGRGSRFVRLERPSVVDPVRDGSRRRAAAVTWSRFHRHT